MESTCITKYRTKKASDADDWSWQERFFHGCNIFPDVINQGNRSVCAFCSTTSAGQMEFNAAVAKTTGKKCMIKFEWESLVTRFLQLHGLRHGDSAEIRKIMEKEIIDGDGLVYDLGDGAAWCFKHLGIRALSYNEEDVDMVNGTILSLSLHDYKRYEKMKDVAVWNYIEAGKAIKTKILVGKEFHYLQEDEIYAWWPRIDPKTRALVELPGAHGIVLAGNGVAGPSLCNEQYHPFLNSHGEGYAKGGVGYIFYKSLDGPFYLLEMKPEPKPAYRTLAQLGHVPRPRLQKTSIPTPPPHGRFPTPDLPPWQSSRGYCPAPVRGRWPTPPRGRDSIDKERWKD